LLLQLAIGPVFLYILNISLQKTIFDGLAAVLAVTIVDYLYITLAVMGVGILIEKPKTKRWLGIISSIVLVVFGIVMILSAINQNGVDPIHAEDVSSIFISFLSVFILTISSPLTIVFWTGLFASKAIEKDYTPKQLIPFGIAAGAATFVFLGASVIMFSFLRAAIPASLLIGLNIAVGAILIIYGIIRLFKTTKNK
jgi:threonine/homoserine/homoserine lactone efflux protein